FSRINYSRVALVLLGLAVAGSGALAIDTIHKYSRDLNNPAILMNEKNTGITIVDRHGVVLFQGFGAVDRHSIPFDEMPASIKEATLATEDPGFYSHPGVSWRGTARA